MVGTLACAGGHYQIALSDKKRQATLLSFVTVIENHVPVVMNGARLRREVTLLFRPADGPGCY